MNRVLTKEEKDELLEMRETSSIEDAAAKFGLTNFFVKQLWNRADNPDKVRFGNVPDIEQPAVILSNTYVKFCIKAFDDLNLFNGKGMPEVWKPTANQREAATVVPALLRELLRLRGDEKLVTLSDRASQASTIAGIG